MSKNTRTSLPLAALFAFGLLSLAAFPGCDDSDSDADSTADASAETDAALASDSGSAEEADAAVDDAGTAPDDAGTEPDAGESDAGTGPSIDPSGNFIGCDLMEFAPEYRNGQFTESAVYSPFDSSLGYFQEVVWFEGGENGIWSLDALRFSTVGTPMPLTVGTHQLEGSNLGNRTDCTLCIDLGRTNLDLQQDVDFYPENVRIDVEAVDIQPGSPLKFSVSGIFREDGDPSKRSWCINGLAVDALIQQMCFDRADCPNDLPACDYPPTGNYPVCMPDPPENGE